MPPTSKKLRGNIGSVLSVCPSVCSSVYYTFNVRILKFYNGTSIKKLVDPYIFFLFRRVCLCRDMSLAGHRIPVNKISGESFEIC